MIKEAQKTKLFINIEEKAYYLSNQRLDDSRFTEYPVLEVLDISNLRIDNTSRYIVLYENSKKEDIVGIGRIRKNTGSKYTLTDNTTVYQKGIQLMYNIDTKVVFEKEQKIKDPIIQKPEVEYNSFTDPFYKVYQMRKSTILPTSYAEYVALLKKEYDGNDEKAF